FPFLRPEEPRRPKTEAALLSLDALLKSRCDGSGMDELRYHLERLKAAEDTVTISILLSKLLFYMNQEVDCAKKRAGQIKIQDEQVPREDALALAGHLRCTQQLVQAVAASISRDLASNDEIRRWLILSDLGATVLLGATLDELLL